MSKIPQEKGGIFVYSNVPIFRSVVLIMFTGEALSEQQWRANTEQSVTNEASQLAARGGSAEVLSTGPTGQAALVAHEPREHKWTTTFRGPTGEFYVSMEADEVLAKADFVRMVSDYVSMLASS